MIDTFGVEKNEHDEDDDDGYGKSTIKANGKRKIL